MHATEKPAERGSQTLARGLRALTIIGESAAPIGVAELAGRLGIHRSMAYRMVSTLEQHGFVERLPSGELELGARLASLARGAVGTLQAAAAPALAAVADELGMTAFLVVHDGESAVTVSNAEPRHADATVAQRPGLRHAIGQGAPGRVIRSQLQPEEFPPQRYERSRDEVLRGLSSIAVPLSLPRGRAAAIAVLYPPTALDEDHVADVLVAAATRISAAMR
ncbi:MAG: helix-turn-helix domain-containing protein [Leucobacter sp.]